LNVLAESSIAIDVLELHDKAVSELSLPAIELLLCQMEISQLVKADKEIYGLIDNPQSHRYNLNNRLQVVGRIYYITKYVITPDGIRYLEHSSTRRLLLKLKRLLLGR
jgi:hypothetical protein